MHNYRYLQQHHCSKKQVEQHVLVRDSVPPVAIIEFINFINILEVTIGFK